MNNFKWIDISKGAGILFVVAGHIFDDGFFKREIYIFHMPLFFFVSGFLLKPSNDTYGFFIKKQSN